jgi:hypothetical protein
MFAYTHSGTDGCADSISDGGSDSWPDDIAYRQTFNFSDRRAITLADCRANSATVREPDNISFSQTFNFSDRRAITLADCRANSATVGEPDRHPFSVAIWQAYHHAYPFSKCNADCRTVRITNICANNKSFRATIVESHGLANRASNNRADTRTDSKSNKCSDGIAFHEPHFATYDGTHSGPNINPLWRPHSAAHNLAVCWTQCRADRCTNAGPNSATNRRANIVAHNVLLGHSESRPIRLPFICSCRLCEYKSNSWID